MDSSTLTVEKSQEIQDGEDRHNTHVDLGDELPF